MTGYYRQLADKQAETINEQAETIRELIRERDAAQDDREAALDFAEQYARKAGIDTDRDTVIGGIGRYWDSRGNEDRRAWELEGFLWTMAQTARELRAGISRQADSPEILEFAARVADRIESANVNRPRRRKNGEPFFHRPPAPGLE